MRDWPLGLVEVERKLMKRVAVLFDGAVERDGKCQIAKKG